MASCQEVLPAHQKKVTTSNSVNIAPKSVAPWTENRAIKMREIFASFIQVNLTLSSCSVKMAELEEDNPVLCKHYVVLLRTLLLSTLLATNPKYNRM